MVDYVKIAATAKRLVEANGRLVTFYGVDQTSSDPAAPWNGPSVVKSGVGTALYGVFVPPNTVRQFGLTALGRGTEFDDLFRFSEQVGIVFPEGGLDLRQFSIVEDGGTEWKIIGLQELKPAERSVLAFVGVRR